MFISHHPPELTRIIIVKAVTNEPFLNVERGEEGGGHSIGFANSLAFHL